MTIKQRSIQEFLSVDSYIESMLNRESFHIKKRDDLNIGDIVEFIFSFYVSEGARRSDTKLAVQATYKVYEYNDIKVELKCNLVTPLYFDLKE